MTREEYEQLRPGDKVRYQFFPSGKIRNMIVSKVLDVNGITRVYVRKVNKRTQQPITLEVMAKNPLHLHHGWKGQDFTYGL